jgi:glycerophosphoryl diester phosphodiesterase
MIACALFSVVALVSSETPVRSSVSDGGNKRVVEVQGHRGARAVLPENTLAAFRHALAAGVDVLELDLQITKDDQLVVAHDPRVPAWCSAREGDALRTMTLAEVQALDCGTKLNARFPKQRASPGEKMPSLAEVLALDDGKVRFNIETKSVPGEPELSAPPARWAELVVAAIDQAKLRKRASVQSFDHRVLHEVKKRAKDITLVALIDESLPDLVLVTRAAKASVASPNHMWLTKDDVARMHKAKLRVVVWTVNEPKDWQRMLDIGVDGIITDDPAALIAWLRERR